MITLSNNLLKEVERLVRKYLRQRARAAKNDRDLTRINGGADRLNLEAADVLDYQASAE